MALFGLVSDVLAVPPRLKKDHQRCSKEPYFADYIVKSKYQIQHVGKDCYCDRLIPDTKAMIGILHTGDIPMIFILSSTISKNIELRVKRYRSELQYAAVSHVWSGGLGNPVQTSLRLLDCYLV